MGFMVADLGNSRLKWGLFRAGDGLEATVSLPLDDMDVWANVWESWDVRTYAWAISTVNPPLASRLQTFLESRGTTEIRWFRSAADVPVRNELEHAETAGADRATAVMAAIAMHSPGQPGLVVSCGSAITVERISAEGVWQGGAIAPGLTLSARSLHEGTAQLPFVAASEEPPAWGRSTKPALEAGIFWGAVGTVRELVSRQAEDLSPAPWLVWTGGDARTLAPHVPWPDSRIVPELVLLGLTRTTSMPSRLTSKP